MLCLCHTARTMTEPAPLKEKDILCLGHLQRVFDLLDALKDVGCERDTAGNRKLFYNDYAKLMLLYIWNPLIGSMHQLQEAVELENVARALGVGRFSTGSFSEAPRVFEPHLLLPIKEELAANLQPGRIHVGDGGYDDRGLLQNIHDADSNYVMRTRENAVFDVVEERLLSQEALDAQVVRDAIVWLGDGSDKPMNHAVRLIEIQVKPHYRRTRKGAILRDRILLLTDLSDLPAELVALIYLHRYGIELFFRIFKQLLGMRHLLSQREEGLEIQTYCTVIVCLLICLISGRKPTLSNRNRIGFYLMGVASEKELLDHLNKEDKTGIKRRVKDELFKKMGF